MKKLFVKANEKFVGNVVLYADSENVLCFDEAKTDKVPAAIVKNLFEKDLILVTTADGMYKPAVFEDKTTHYEVSIQSKTFKSATIE